MKKNNAFAGILGVALLMASGDAFAVAAVSAATPAGIGTVVFKGIERIGIGGASAKLAESPVVTARMLTLVGTAATRIGPSGPFGSDEKTYVAMGNAKGAQSSCYQMALLSKSNPDKYQLRIFWVFAGGASATTEVAAKGRTITLGGVNEVSSATQHAQIVFCELRSPTDTTD